MEFGRIYTLGSSFRARAEARQREYRANVLQVGCGKYGHFLDERAVQSGANFLVEEAHEGAKERRDSGKGVTRRTLENMLSSQAMCFNLFAPLQSRLDLASEVLQKFIPQIETINEISIEYTPDNIIFGDQTGLGGVDCDLLIEGTDNSGDGIVVVCETKFVETEFSVCGYRKPGRKKNGREVCQNDIAIQEDRGRCLYVRNKGYKYWDRSDALNVLNSNAAPEVGCPFGGEHWQLWVNHVLVHAEAERRGAKTAVFAVCAPLDNSSLLKEGEVLGSFRGLLRDPETAVFIDVDGFMAVLKENVEVEMAGWVDQAIARYGNI